MSGMSSRDVLDEMQDEYGLAHSCTQEYIGKVRTRLEELQRSSEETLWARQVARLEQGAVNAHLEGDWLGQAALEGQLTKVAGTAAPERFIHQHQVAVVDVRAVEIDAELRRIREASHGPKAIAAPVSDLGVLNPEDVAASSDSNTARPERATKEAQESPAGAPQEVTERARRGNRTLGKIFGK